MKPAIIICCSLLIPTFAFSSTIRIPADYPMIQQGIDAADQGDTVLVAPGTYVENINFKGKTITVKSSNGAGVTMIDGGNPMHPDCGSVVTFIRKEGASSRLEGFTITNGPGTKTSGGTRGGGIYCWNNAAPIITNNVISGNKAGSGGGIYCGLSSPTIINNTISGNNAGLGGGISCDAKASPTITNNSICDNKADAGGGGIACMDSSSPIIANNIISNNFLFWVGNGGGISISNSYPIITNNLISDNSAGHAGAGGGIYCYHYSAPTIINNLIFKNYAGEYGGGIECNHHSSPTILNNTIAWNTADYGGGIVCRYDASMTITNTILWSNHAYNGGQEIVLGAVGSSSTITINHSDVKGGKALVYVFPNCTLNWGSGMIDSNPLFVDSTNDDYHLTFNSPCRDSGNNWALCLPISDFEGDPRITYSVVDMGADEFHTHLYFTGNATPGGKVEIKLVDLPGTSPVCLWVGSGVLGAPIPTMFGDWFLESPILLTVGLGSITTPSGVSVLPYTFDPAFPAMEIPMQAGIGMKLTNLCEMRIQ